MALHDLDHDTWIAFDRLEGAARATLRWTTIVRRPGLTRRPSADLGRASGRDRRPLPPSRRLPWANMGRAAFLLLIAGWLTVVVALLALVLVIRSLA